MLECTYCGTELSNEFCLTIDELKFCDVSCKDNYYDNMCAPKNTKTYDMHIVEKKKKSTKSTVMITIATVLALLSLIGRCLKELN